MATPPEATNWGVPVSPQAEPFNPGWDQTNFPQESKTAGPPPQRASSPRREPLTDFSPGRSSSIGTDPNLPQARIRDNPPLGEIDPKTPQAYKDPAPRPMTEPPILQTGLPGDALQTMVRVPARKEQRAFKLLVIQYCHFIPGVAPNDWQSLHQVQVPVHILGRDSFGKEPSIAAFLAQDHLRIFVEEDRVSVEEGETINGVYAKLPARRPFELHPGTRFAVGEQLIEFERPMDTGFADPAISKNGETLRWRRLEPLAYLNFVGPDNGPGVRFPLTKGEGTVIGREGDIALGPDRVASRMHARISLKGDRFFLEDLGSKNGTFVRISGRSPIKPHNRQDNVSPEEFLIGEVLIRLQEV